MNWKEGKGSIEGSKGIYMNWREEKGIYMNWKEEKGSIEGREG